MFRFSRLICYIWEFLVVAADNLSLFTFLEKPIREEDMETIACAISSYYNPLGRALGYEHEKVQETLKSFLPLFEPGNTSME